MEVMPLQWLQSIPPVTRSYILCSTALSLAEYLGYIEVSDLLLSSNTPFNFNKIGKILLNSLYNGPLSVNFSTKLYLFSRYSNWLETSMNSPSRFIWMIMILITAINLYSIYITKLTFIGPILKETFLCIWCRNHMDDDLFFLMFSLKASWVPITTYFLDLAISTSRDPNLWLSGLSGMVIGHLYWFINEELPKLHGSKSLLCPIWEWNLFQFQPQQQELPNDNIQNDIDPIEQQHPHQD